MQQQSPQVDDGSTIVAEKETKPIEEGNIAISHPI